MLLLASGRGSHGRGISSSCEHMIKKFLNLLIMIWARTTGTIFILIIAVPIILLLLWMSFVLYTGVFGTIWVYIIEPVWNWILTWT